MNKERAKIIAGASARIASHALGIPTLIVLAPEFYIASAIRTTYTYYKDKRQYPWIPQAPLKEWLKYSHSEMRNSLRSEILFVIPSDIKQEVRRAKLALKNYDNERAKIAQLANKSKSK